MKRYWKCWLDVETGAYERNQTITTLNRVSKLAAPEHYSDKELFLRIGHEDEEAFLLLFHRYVPQLRPVMLQLVRKETLIPDLIQDIFMRIWLNRNKLSEIKSPRSWIFTLAYHHCFNYLRHLNIEVNHADQLRTRTDAGPDHESPAAIVELLQTKQTIAEAVAALPQQARKVYQLRREHGLSIDEIAHALNIAPKTVKNTLSRALDQLRGYLQSKDIYLPVFLLMMESQVEKIFSQ